MKITIILFAMLMSYFTHQWVSSDNKEAARKELSQEKDKKKKDGKKKDKKDPDKKESDKKADKKNRKQPRQYESTHRIEIVDKWILPAQLKEISGMTFIDENTVACVQDESGNIFIYDLAERKIKKTIPFSGPGDYEGIANVNGTYYVLVSDGTIIKASGNSTNSEKYQTGLSVNNNCEGLYYDKGNHRLLIAIKATDHTDPMIKGIYSFDLRTMKAASKPVAFVDLNSPELADTLRKKDLPQRRYHPSDLAIDPVTKDILIVNGVNSSLMLLTPENKVRTIISLDKKIFPQPEGIAYSPSGKLYISSEGAEGNGVIAECRIVKQ